MNNNSNKELARIQIYQEGSELSYEKKTCDRINVTGYKFQIVTLRWQERV